MTIFLRFPDEATAQNVLSDFYSADFGWNKASLVHALDPVGILYTPGTYDADGNQITAPVAQAGWCVNFIGQLPPAAAEQYVIVPATPRQVFAT